MFFDVCVQQSVCVIKSVSFHLRSSTLWYPRISLNFRVFARGPVEAAPSSDWLAGELWGASHGW
jgi:hypothetical protein